MAIIATDLAIERKVLWHNETNSLCWQATNLD